uniref:Uncharacterized protein n=1 Tax=Sphaerodactylus townsendi TaxID=933632 RepID=A0ACB8G7M3_9SAUR
MLSVWILFVLLFLKTVGVPRWSISTHSGYNYQGYYKEGDRIIGGFIPLTKPPNLEHRNFRNPPNRTRINQILDIYAYPHLLVFIHAVEEINRSPRLLPNTSLGFHIYDSVFCDETALGGIWGLLSGTRKLVPNYHCGGDNKLVAVIEGPTASLSLGIATVLGLYRYPQLSYGLLDPARRSKVLFPALYGMVPSESSLLSGIARLIRHFNWRWVGLMAIDDDRGEMATETLAREIGKGGGCLAFTCMFKRYHSYTEKVRQLLGIIYKSSANVTVLYETPDHTISLYMLCFSDSIWMRRQVWILTAREEFLSQAKYLCSMIFRHLFLVKHKRESPGFQDFIQRIKPWHYPGDVLTFLFLVYKQQIL